MANLAQLQTALVNADKAGDMDAARKLASIIKKEQGARSSDPYYQVPGSTDQEVAGTTVKPPEPTLGDQAIGAGETALAVGTGATTGTVGMMGGMLKGIAQEIIGGQFGTQAASDRIAQEAGSGASALTYAPKTEAGQQMTEKVGEVMQQLAPLLPATQELGTIREAMSLSKPYAAAAIQQAASPIKQAAVNLAESVKNKITGVDPTPGTGTSVGATDVATMRQAAAESLPVPMKLTQGQKTRSFEAQRFEQETAKNAEIGAPIRQRFQEQNLQLQQNMDAFIDATGAELTDLRGVGEIVDKALRQRAVQDKVRIRTLYKEAEKSGEMLAPVDVSPVLKVLDDSVSAESTAPILVATRKELARLSEKSKEAPAANSLSALEEEARKNKYFELDDPSPAQIVAEREWQKRYNEAKKNIGPTEPITLAENSLTLADAEQLRKFVNKVTGNDPTNIKFSRDIKEAIDLSTEGKGGELYKSARAARARYANEYENVGLVKQLLGTKRGGSDRAIALEDVLRKTVLDPGTSLDQMRQVRRLLQTRTGGNEGVGAQAWREVQGATIRHMQEQMTKNVARDAAGNPIVSAAALDKVVTQLDKTGKLDYLFGKKGAEQLRTINDVAKYVLTSPPGTINTSNTAAVLAGLMDVAVTGMSGIPAPIATSFRLIASGIKDAKLKARVNQALGE